MTREQLDAIRARVEAAPKVGDTFIDENGDEMRIVETFEDRDFVTLLAEVERLTAEIEAKTTQNVALIGQNGRLQQEVERLTAEVEMLRGVGCAEDGDGPCGACRKCAFQRGVAAMREAAVKECHPMLRSMVSRSELADDIRNLPDPEDKP